MNLFQANAYLVVIQGLLHCMFGYPMERSSLLSRLINLINDQAEVMRSTKGSSYLMGYQSCVKRMNQDQIKTQADYVYSVEGEDLAFRCGECVPPSLEVFWGWITFEGVDTKLSSEVFVPLNYTMNYHELVIRSPSPDLSSLYCFWMDKDIQVVSNVWTVEVVGISRMRKISARKWRKVKKEASQVRANLPVNLKVGKTELRVETVWSEWSLCSKCGGEVGKRYKTGVCSVTWTRDGILEALNVHKLPVSCSLLIDFHPEILTDSEVFQDFGKIEAMNEVLGRPHRILVGYCKGERVCDLNVGSKVRELYRTFEMMGDGEEVVGDKVEVKWWSVRYLFWIMESLLKGVPVGWKYTPDMMLLLGLVGLQLYVIFLVIKRRKQAN